MTIQPPCGHSHTPPATWQYWIWDGRWHNTACCWHIFAITCQNKHRICELYKIMIWLSIVALHNCLRSNIILQNVIMWGNPGSKFTIHWLTSVRNSWRQYIVNDIVIKFQEIFKKTKRTQIVYIRFRSGLSSIRELAAKFSLQDILYIFLWTSHLQLASLFTLKQPAWGKLTLTMASPDRFPCTWPGTRFSPGRPIPLTLPQVNNSYNNIELIYMSNLIYCEYAYSCRHAKSLSGVIIDSKHKITVMDIICWWPLFHWDKCIFFVT